MKVYEPRKALPVCTDSAVHSEIRDLLKRYPKNGPDLVYQLFLYVVKVRTNVYKDYIDGFMRQAEKDRKMMLKMAKKLGKKAPKELLKEGEDETAEESTMDSAMTQALSGNITECSASDFNCSPAAVSVL